VGGGGGGIAGAVVAVPVAAAITSAVRALQHDDNDGRARTAGGVISG
jgi:predicted PurR-regulated permease PerM